MSTSFYDHIIIGAGAAGLHLLLAMLKEEKMQDRRILLLDKEAKTENDRTWSFWEIGKGKWDHLISKSWDFAMFHGDGHTIKNKLAPYAYKTLEAKDFYTYAKSEIAKAQNVDWIQDEVASVQKAGDFWNVRGTSKQWKAVQIFDSRPPGDEYRSHGPAVLQHFVGWFVRSNEPVFKPGSFEMMDFRYKEEQTCSFMYVLPFTDTEALIEFTYFSNDLHEQAYYQEQISNYIRKEYPSIEIEVLRKEQGVIPMSSYPFHKYNQEGLMNIGTRGGWVKASTGYSFKNSEQLASKVVHNIVKQRDPAHGLIKNRYRFYDKLFLDVLERSNELGEKLFSIMYTKHPIQRVFRFLDEESSIWDDMKIIWSYRKTALLKALFRNLF